MHNCAHLEDMTAMDSEYAHLSDYGANMLYPVHADGIIH